VSGQNTKANGADGKRGCSVITIEFSQGTVGVRDEITLRCDLFSSDFLTKNGSMCDHERFRISGGS
jgi:hypothetical protein